MSEQLHLQEVQRQCRAAGPAAGEEAVGHGADVQQVGHTHRHHLAELPVQRVWPLETKLGTAAGGAGEPGEEGGGREEHLSQHALCPGGVGAVQAQSQSAAVLIDGHAHVVQEEERVMRLLRMRLQQVSRGTATQNSGH